MSRDTDTINVELVRVSAAGSILALYILEASEQILTVAGGADARSVSGSHYEAMRSEVREQATIESWIQRDAVCPENDRVLAPTLTKYCRTEDRAHRGSGDDLLDGRIRSRAEVVGMRREDVAESVGTCKLSCVDGGCSASALPIRLANFDIERHFLCLFAELDNELRTGGSVAITLRA